MPKGEFRTHHRIKAVRDMACRMRPYLSSVPAPGIFKWKQETNR